MDSGGLSDYDNRMIDLQHRQSDRQRITELQAEREKDKARIAELEQRLRRINAINDNPAVFNKEIDELSTVL